MAEVTKAVSEDRRSIPSTAPFVKWKKRKYTNDKAKIEYRFRHFVEARIKFDPLTPRTRHGLAKNRLSICLSTSDRTQGCARRRRRTEEATMITEKTRHQRILTIMLMKHTRQTRRSM